MDTQLFTAFKAQSFPVNPLPFLNGLMEGCREYGFDWIKSDEAKSLIHIINSQSYGQLYNIDAVDEYGRLKEAL